MPDFTFIACARAVTLAGLQPVFVDCDERLLMDLTLLPRGSGISRVFMPVHVHGRRVDMEAIQAWRDNWPSSPTLVIEDLAEAHSVRPHPLTDAACWSFNRTKVIAGEEGGAVAFRDPEHADYARLLRSQGNRGDWQHIPRGMNYRMQNCSAELIRRSLHDWCDNVCNRREVESWYDELCPDEWRMPPRDVPWLYDLRVPGLSAEKQSEVVNALRAASIEARCGFKPCSFQEEYFGKAKRVNGGQSLASVVSREIVALPIVPGVTTRASCGQAFGIIRRCLSDRS